MRSAATIARRSPASASRASWPIRFHRAFGDRNFKAGPFSPPDDPERETAALRAELAALRERFAADADEAQKARLRAEEEARRRLTAEEQARAAADERALWEQLATEADRKVAEALSEVAALRTAAASVAPVAIAEATQQAAAAADKIDLDEQETRRLIDRQLRDAGWEADTERLRHANGARPQAGRFMAIAEWPTRNRPADYLLFAGLRPVAGWDATG